jgi:hypothetical protein
MQRWRAEVRMAMQQLGMRHDRRTTMVTVAAIVLAAALVAFLVVTLMQAGKAY